MHHRLLLGLSLLVGLNASASAGTDEFPYDAVVDSDSVMVRSGPGQKYYATGRLNRGDQVVIHRHDPGGWYMIAPPAGSFSWIRADAVNRLGEHRGVLEENNVAVRVGSTLDDEAHDVFQSRLSKGAAVEILGEKTFETPGGPVRMFKIASPKGEWRWIPGRTVVPAEEFTGRDGKDRPYEVRQKKGSADDRENAAPALLPPGGRTTAAKPTRRRDLPSGTVERVPEKTTDGAVHRRGPAAEELARDRRRLDELDERFRAMVDRDPGSWDLAGLRQGYRALQKETSSPAIANQVNLRLSTLDRYEAIKADYDSFIQLTTRTEQRDAELRAIQQAHLRAADGTRPLSRPARPPRKAVPQPAEPHPPARFAPPILPQAEPPAGQPRSQHGPTLLTPSAPGPGLQASTPPSAGRGQAGRPVPNGAPPRAVPTGPTPAAPPRKTPRAAPRGAPAPPPGPPAARQQRPVPPTGPPAAGTPRAESAPRGPQPPRGQRASQASAMANGQKLIAAGIVQRAANPGAAAASRHVLLAPSGRILAYLQPQSGVDLDRYLGRPMGIYGRRVPGGGRQPDTLHVVGLRPVRLQR